MWSKIQAWDGQGLRLMELNGTCKNLAVTSLKGYNYSTGGTKKGKYAL